MSNLLGRADADIAIAKLLLSPAGNPDNDTISRYKGMGQAF